jgi:hypothetical protein
MRRTQRRNLHPGELPRSILSPSMLLSHQDEVPTFLELLEVTVKVVRLRTVQATRTTNVGFWRRALTQSALGIGHACRKDDLGRIRNR